METQENYRAPRHEEYQQIAVLNGAKVWCDPKMIPLLQALNNAGLITRSHCEGHETGKAWVAIRADNIAQVEVRTHEPYNEILICWEPTWSPKSTP